VKKERAELVEKNHPKLSVRTQCELLEVPRSSLDYRPVGESEEDRELMRLMDEIYRIDPCIGTRRLVKVLERDHGRKVNRKRLRRLRREMGLETIWCRPRNTSAPDKAHRKYPYLLGSLEVKRPEQAWCADITYVPMSRGHAYLCVVMDWYSRKVLGWRLSNTMEAGLEAWFDRSNARRPHEALGNRTPSEALTAAETSERPPAKEELAA
jgi:putative transposase